MGIASMRAMVSSPMRRYRQRRSEESALVLAPQDGPLDLVATFGRRAPWRIDIGFGHGEFLAAMAARHPDEDFLGVEHKDIRITKTARACLRSGARNVRLARTEAHAFVRLRLPQSCLHRAYVLFPDPWPKAGHRRRRLLNRCLLLDLAWAMAPGGRLTIATDEHAYAMLALSNISAIPGIWINRYDPPGYRLGIATRFPTVFERHKKAEGKEPCYLLLERSLAEAPPRLAWTPSPTPRSPASGDEGAA